MNERIRELAEQAESYANSKIHMTGWNYREEYNKRFAELIVRECMKEAMEEIVSDEDIAQEQEPLICEYLKGNNQGIVDAVVRFRNHFGVE